MANLTDGTNLTGTIVLSKATGTKVTLDTDHKYLTKDIELTVNAPTSTVTSSGATVSYTEGWVTAGSTTVTDANLLAANIKKDVTIFGVTGTLTGNNVVISDTIDTAGGTIRTITTDADPVILQEKTNITPGASSVTVTPDNGYDAMTSVQINGDADLIASNIKSGVSIFGVTGSYAGGAGYEGPTITITLNSSTYEVTSITCDKTLAECVTYFNAHQNERITKILCISGENSWTTSAWAFFNGSNIDSLYWYVETDSKWRFMTGLPDIGVTYSSTGLSYEYSPTLPAFILVYNSGWTEVQSVQSANTYAECNNFYNNGRYIAIISFYNGTQYTGGYAAANSWRNSTTGTISYYIEWNTQGVSDYRIDYASDGTLSFVNNPIARRSSSDLTASTLTVTAPAGYYASSATKTLTDANLIAGNIKKDVSIFGVVGTLETNNVYQDANGYIVVDSSGSGTGISASQHTIHLDFSDTTSADVNVYYNDAAIGNIISSYSPSTWTYNSKTVTAASLDNVTWYDTTTIPLNTQLIDFTKITNDYVINSSGETVAEQWYSVTDYTPIAPNMTFQYKACRWWYGAFYTASKVFISSFYIDDDTTESPLSSNIGIGTLSGNEIPSNAAYIRLTSVYMTSDDTDAISLIRTA